MQDRRLAISEIELTNAEPTTAPSVTPRYSQYRRLIGIMTLVLLLILISFEAPRIMKDNLNVCVAQYAADNKISTQALSTDLINQPEFVEAISLCSATNP